MRRLHVDDAQIILTSCKGGAKDGVAETAHEQLKGKQVTIFSTDQDSKIQKIDIRHFRSKPPRISAEFTTGRFSGYTLNSTVTYEDQ